MSADVHVSGQFDAEYANRDTSLEFKHVSKSANSAQACSSWCHQIAH